MVELTVIGISLQGDGGSPVLLLHPHATDSILSLFVGPMEAFAISTALHGSMSSGSLFSLLDTEAEQALYSMQNLLRAGGLPAATSQRVGFSRLQQSPQNRPALRPMTHDFMLNMMHMLGGRLQSVDLTRMEQGIYFAEAVIETSTGTARMDCRPSDGIALALRCRAKVRATSAVLAHVKDMSTVLTQLPAHIRTLAEAALIAEEKAARMAATKRDYTKIPIVADRIERQRPNVTVVPSEAPEGRKFGLHVSFVRHDKNTDAPAGMSAPVNNLLYPTAPADGQISIDPALPEEERWSTLLRVLAPETKVCM